MAEARMTRRKAEWPRIFGIGKPGEWVKLAACASPDVDEDLFFAPEKEKAKESERRIRRAKRVCEECPVMLECRVHAIRANEPDGVWGGQTEAERRNLS